MQDSYVSGTVFFFQSMEELAQELSDAGFTVTTGQWALHLTGCARRFEIAYVGNLSPEAPFQVTGDGYGLPVQAVAECCERLSACLRERGIGHDFLHASGRDEEIRAYQFAP